MLDINTFEDQLVLKVGVHLNSGAWEHLNALDLLTTEEVLDLNSLTVLGDDDVNGEMSMYESHLISVTLKTYKIIINIKSSWRTKRY